jgi:hypothetical protein
MQRPRAYSLALLAAVLLAVPWVSSCAAGSTADVALPGVRSPSGPATSRTAPGPSSPRGTPASPASPAGTSPAGPPLPPSPPPGCDSQPWRTVPVQVTRQVAVPPVPVVTAIRTGSHPACGYDRIVVHISGPMPGYDIRYVKKVANGSSGPAVVVPGRRYLLITIHPAQGHSPSGASTISRPSAATSYPMLRGYAVTGDFEGVLNIAVGMEKATAFRVGRLRGRLYVDVAG